VCLLMPVLLVIMSMHFSAIALPSANGPKTNSSFRIPTGPSSGNQPPYELVSKIVNGQKVLVLQPLKDIANLM